MRRGLVRLARSASAAAGSGASLIRKRLQEIIIPRMDGGLNSMGASALGEYFAASYAACHGWMRCTAGWSECLCRRIKEINYKFDCHPYKRVCERHDIRPLEQHAVRRRILAAASSVGSTQVKQ